MRSRFYLDHNATAPLHPKARQAMLEFLGDRDANPSSLYLEAEQVRGDFEDAREMMAACLGIRGDELTFTSGASESINWAIRGVVGAHPERRKVVTSQVEHAVTLDVAKHLGEQGYDICYLAVDSAGQLNLAEVEAALDDNTAILSLMWTNNETGVTFDIEKIGHLARAAGVPFHVDGAQKVGKGLGGLGDLPVDLLSFSGHKFGAPKGVGGLYVRRGVSLRPLIWGGQHETGRRGGTENVSGVMAMAAALEVATSTWPDVGPRLRRMRDELESNLGQEFPDMLINGADAQRNENTLSVCFPKIEGHGVVLTLSQKGLACASGSACTAHDEGPSHVLEAMGVPHSFIHGALRFSLGSELKPEEIEEVTRLIIAAVGHLSRF